MTEDRQEAVESPLEELAGESNGDDPIAEAAFPALHIHATRNALLHWLRDQADRIERATGEGVATPEHVEAMVEIHNAFERAHRTER